jgi:hypothetical protein
MRGPQVIEFEWLLHVQQDERHEVSERNDFRPCLELRQRPHRVSDAVRRHLQEALEQRDASADERCNPPGRLPSSLRWAHHANVMKTFDADRSSAVCVHAEKGHPDLGFRQ